MPDGMIRRAFGAVSGLALLLLAVCQASAATWYVDAAATPGGDGASWQTAFQAIQPAVNAAGAAGGGDVWIAAGTYNLSSESSPGPITLLPGVHLYGGFSGDENSIEERNEIAAETVIVGGATQPELAPTAVIGASNCSLDSLTIRGANSGVVCYGISELAVNNCVIERNVAESGGGIRIEDSANISITGCTIRSNLAREAGGLMCANVQGFYLENTEFSDNASVRTDGPNAIGGGAALVEVTNLEILNCRVSGNTTSGTGGGFTLVVIDSGVISGCTFQDNSASVYGGAIHYSPNESSNLRDVVFKNSQFLRNRANGRVALWLQITTTLMFAKQLPLVGRRERARQKIVYSSILHRTLATVYLLKMSHSEVEQ